ncbi:tetratricopeptide repeat protein [Methylotuvimicrobium sp. KM1]|uniref:tetratricopeptide repeat protein n=1 Tax=Methylotuvimicrobium sp. KM1 TaxID=3377707 RepID=UPI00384F1654
MFMVKLAFHRALLGIAVIVMSGCGWSLPDWPTKAIHDDPISYKPAKSCGEDPEPKQNVKLDLIRQLMDSGKLYAALAHLDDARSLSLQSNYLRAEILRRTGRSEMAATLYRELLESCMVGKGYHGLGLIAGRNRQINEAIDFLQKAANELPVDTRVRNDLGYALLLGGQFDSARNEFLTALELDGGDRLAASNMVLLLSVMDKEQEIRVFSTHMKIDSETMVQLRAQAEEIKATLKASGRIDMLREQGLL